MNFWPIVVLALLTASTANGQGSWSYEESYGAYQTRVRDGLELPDGSWVLATMARGTQVGLPGQFWLTRIGADGEWISSARIWDPGIKTIVSVLQPMGGDRFRAFGTVGDVDTTEAYFHYDSNSGLDRLDSGVVTYPGLHRLGWTMLFPFRMEVQYYWGQQPTRRYFGTKALWHTFPRMGSC